jgi:ABC-type antimicrobial peptide transport system permease subunit
LASGTELALDFIDAKLAIMPFPLQHTKSHEAPRDRMHLGPLGPGVTARQAELILTDTAHFLNVREDAAMQLYLPRRPDDTYIADAILARVRSDPRALVPVIQRELVSLEVGLRFTRVRPFQELIDPQTRSWTLGATMFTVFGLLALLVAAVGLYSVLAFAVAQRRHELGIRAALGASRERLLAMVLAQGLRLVVVGTSVGLLIALLGGSYIRDLLFETSPHDPVVLGAVAAVLLGVAVLASSIPAWRATRVDPSVALRAE